MEHQTLKQIFTERFSGTAENIKIYFAPGRVNLIGEHIDYNGGFVMPGALTLGITALLRKRTDGVYRFASLNHEGEFQLDSKSPIVFDKMRSWGNYPAGIVSHLQKEGYQLSGADMLFWGNLPDGAGLSSSAALEILVGYAILNEQGISTIDRIWLAKFAQQVENQFVGVNCGIMDQFSVAMGKENQAILLNCQNLDFEYTPLELSGYDLVIMNTNKRRELAEGKYNERRAECEEALTLIRQHTDVPDLCSADLYVAEKAIKDATLLKRARHCISENIRVKEAFECLKKGQLSQFGQLLKESHNSLKNDYEVTGKELDAIAQAANKHPACLGARMTGAGFGGCAIAIVKTELLYDFQQVVARRYTEQTGLKPDFYVSKLGEGVRFLS